MLQECFKQEEKGCNYHITVRECDSHGDNKGLKALVEADASLLYWWQENTVG